MAFLSGYTTRKKITIDKDKIDSNLTDFPVLVKLTSSNFDFSKANSDGYDIRFTSADGTTLLKYERERHDATNKLAEYWVKIPSISSTANTDFYIYYRTTDTDDGADPTNVWDSNFKMVQHMKDKTTSTIEDSTSNNNDGTKKAANEPIETDGKIAKAQDFDGSNDKIEMNGLVADMGSSTVGTIELWFDPKAVNVDNRLFYFGDSGTDYNLFQIIIGSNNSIIVHLKGTSNIYKMTYSPASLSGGNWYYLVFTVDANGNKLYWNGEQVTPSYSVGSATNTEFFDDLANEDKCSLGVVLSGGSYYGSSKIDEVRVSDTTIRSTAWIKASYNSGNNSLVSYGGEEEEGIDNVLFFGCNF